MISADDLFDDEDDTPKKKVAKDSAPPKQKYLDQKWKLAEEDAKEFTGFAKKEGTNARLMERLDSMEEVPPADRVPSVALIYNFRREYKEQNLEATLAEHRAHCLKFNKRLLHSEVINTKKTKGVVLLWIGLAPGDDLVRQEMMLFMEEDPLIVKDIVDNWNIQVTLAERAKIAVLSPDVSKLISTYLTPHVSILILTFQCSMNGIINLTKYNLPHEASLFLRLQRSFQKRILPPPDFSQPLIILHP